MTLRVCFLLVAFSLCARAGEQISFSALKPGETIRVRFSSRGCFHSIQQEFVFRGGSPVKVTASEIPREWSATRKAFVEKDAKIYGTADLSKKALSRLDATLAFYRKPHFGGCTTVDFIELKLLHGKTLVRAEKYTDSTCDIDQQKNLLTFPRVAGMAGLKTP